MDFVFLFFEVVWLTRIFKKLGSLPPGELDCLVVDEDSGVEAVCEGRLAADLVLHGSIPLCSPLFTV